MEPEINREKELVSDRTNRPKTVPFYRTLKSVQRFCPWIRMETWEKKEETLKDSGTVSYRRHRVVDANEIEVARPDEGRAQFRKSRSVLFRDCPDGV